MNNKILFILHIPPPVHGSSMVGKYIMDSNQINTVFDTKYINLGTSKSIDDIGKKPMSKIISYLKIVFLTIKQLLIFKPDLVYLAMTAKGVGFYKDFVIAFISKIFGIQLVLHFHNKGVSLNQHKKLDNFLYKIVFSTAKVILLSKHLYPDIKKYVNEKNVYYCPNGIPVIEQIEKSSESRSHIPNILFLSNLIKSKGVFVLLEALQILQQKDAPFTCNFVGGEGDVSAELFNSKVIEMGLEKNVFYLGKKYKEDKIEIFSKSDIFVLPTFYHNECFPLVLLEAMQFNLPLISTYEGGIPEIIEDEVNGFIVKQSNIVSLLMKLEELVTNKELRIKMGKAGNIKFSNEYTLEKFEHNMVNIFKTINN